MPFTKVSEQEKCFIIAKFEEGWSIRAVARHFHHNKSTILRIKRRWEQEHTTRRNIGSGRKRISTPNQDEELKNRL
jgi:transposase